MKTVDKIFAYTFGILGILFGMTTVHAMFLTPFNELLFVVMGSCWFLCTWLFLLIMKSHE